MDDSTAPECTCPLCTVEESAGPICAPCWRVIVTQRQWSDAYHAISAAMHALRGLGDDAAAAAVERLAVWRADFADQVLGELPPR